MDKFRQHQEVMHTKDLPNIPHRVRITFVHNLYNPTLYSCQSLDGKKDLAFYENELESVWEHDKRVGIIP